MSHATAGRYAWTEPGVEDLGGGVHRIPLPLPMEGLRAVNVYAIADPGGVDLIDAGIALVPAREQLTAALRQIGYELGDIRNFFVTHIHIDHYSLAVELRKTFHNVISLGEAGARQPDRDQGDGHRQREQVLRIDGLRRLGALELVTELSAQHRQPPALIDWEDPDRWLADGTDLDLRTRTLRAVHTPGHTRGHLVYHDAAAQLMFAGDHVLPHITPSIGFEAAGNRMALSDYLGSLARTLALPDARLLPAHGPGHRQHPRASPRAAGPPRHAPGRDSQRRAGRPRYSVRGGEGDQVDPAAPGVHRPGPVQPGPAVNETAAHLEVLAIRGQLTH